MAHLPAWLGGLKRWVTTAPVLHPFLFAAFPVLFLAARNLDEYIVVKELLRPLGLAVGCVAFLVIGGGLIFRNLKLVGFVASVWTLLFFSYGHAASWLAHKHLTGIELGSDSTLLTVWAVLAVAGVGVALVLRKRLVPITQGLNLVALVLVAINIVPIVLYRSSSGVGSVRPAGEVSTRVLARIRGHRLPDIYYIIPDRYGTWRMHRRTYGINTRPFIDFLKRKGFYVATRSLGNFGSTHQSLAASLNMQYLQTVLGKNTIPKKPLVYSALRNPRVVRFLKAIGYRYLLSSSYPPMRTDPAVDAHIGGKDLIGFSQILYTTTVLPALSRVFGVAEERLDPRRKSWRSTLTQLAQLARAPQLRGPKFVFTHLLLPHPPYVFDRSGKYVTRKQERGRARRLRYSDQVLFANKKLEEVIKALLADRANPPIIVIQADEGQWPVQFWSRPEEFDYHAASRVELLDKYQIINAYYLPGVPHTSLYPSITPVNSFRLIFNLYFDAGFRLLPDKVYGRDLRPYYHFVEITHQLRQGRNARGHRVRRAT